MYQIRVFLASSLFLMFGSTLGWGQSKNEIGLLIGGTLTPGQTVSSTSGISPGAPIDFNAGFNFTAEYDRRLVRIPFAELQAGIDLAVSPNDVKVGSGPPTARTQYAYLFLTPELRVKFLPGAWLSPWVSVGGGLAKYAEAGKLLNGQPARSLTTSHGAVEFSGGIDLHSPLHFLVPIDFRVEVRDYYAGKPNLNLDTGGGFANNVVAAGGVVLHF